MIEQRIQLNLIPNSRTVKVRCSQYDDQARKIIIELFNGSAAFTIPDGTTVQIRGTKPSGKGFSYSCTFSGNTVTATITGQMTVVAGSVCCEIILTNGTKTLGTANFILEVEKAAMTAGTIIDSDDFASIIKEEVRACANEKLIELEVDQALDETSEKAVSNKAVTAEFNSAKNNFANAIRGKLSGAVVFADDVSPVDHKPVVKVHGKNLFDPAYSAGSHSFDALSTWGNIVIDKAATAKMLKPNTVYTLSFTAECIKEVEYATFQFAGIGFILYNNGMEVNIGRYWSDQESDWLSLGETKSYSKTFTTPSNLEGWVIMGYTQRALDSSGNAVTNVLKFTNFQIEEGEKQTDYKAKLDPSTVSVKRYGKNLLKNTLAYSKSCGVTRIVNSDGSIYLVGASTEVHGIGLNSTIKLPNGKYIISGGKPDLFLVIWGKSIETGEWVSIAPDKGNGAEFEANNALYSVYLAQYQALSGVNYNTISYPMIRAAGFENDDFEAYHEPTEYTPEEDGTVPGMVSLSPCMTILMDTEGAIVECEYNRDSNKVIEKLVNAVIALGGTV